MAMPLNTRTLQLLGTLNVIFGLGVSAMCILALGMLLLQRTVMGSLESSPEFETFERMHAITASAWIRYMPLGVVLGALFALSGRWLRSGEPRGKTLAWCVVLGAAASFAGYAAHLFARADEVGEAMSGPFLGARGMEGFLVASMIATAAVVFAYPAVLLFLLRRPFPSSTP